MTIVFKNAYLIDGTGQTLPNAAVIVDGNTITAVERDSQAAASTSSYQVIDAAGMVLMPGLWDLHVHLHGQAGPNGEPHLLAETSAYQAVILAENARRTLEAGFTTIRDMGAPNDINIDLSRAVADGLLPGPRIIPVATIDMTTLPGDYDVHGTRGGVTGPIEARKMARQKIASGAEVIHVKATGAGFGQFGPHVLILSVEELRAAVEETHKLGMRTTAHACGSTGMKNAVIAGVQCIEHGQWLYADDELVRMMVDRQVGWVPTLMNNPAKQAKIHEARERGLETGLPKYVEQRIPEMIEAHRRSYERALEAGVLTPLGSDCGAPFTPNGTNAVEMEFFVRYGASEMHAIESATRIAAQVMRMDDRYGSVENGKEADMILVKENPLEDIRVLQNKDNILLVMKSGEIVVDRRNGSTVTL